MKSTIWVLLFLVPIAVSGQNPEVKLIADTLVVQADGTYDADPDLATLTFQIFRSGQGPEAGLCQGKPLGATHRRDRTKG
jgi:hypothetical protein